MIVAAAFALVVAAAASPVHNAPVWSARVPAAPMRPCVAVDDVVLQGLENGHLVAFTRATGALAWDVKVGRTSWHAAPAVVGAAGGAVGEGGAVVVAGAFAGPAVALDASSGAVKWRAPMDGVVGAAVAKDGVVFVGTIGGLVALDLHTGFERGRFPTLGGVPAIAVDGSRVIFESFTDNALIAADVDSVGAYVFLHESWRLRGPALEHDAQGNPTRFAGFQAESIPIEGGIAFVPTNVAEIWAVDVATGKKRWGYEPRGSVVNAPAYGNGTLFLAATNGSSVEGSRSSRIAAVDAATGVEKWAVDLPHTLSMGGPIVTRSGDADVVVVGDDAKELIAFDAATGKRAFIVPLPGASWWAACADRDGTVYVADDNRHLTAIR